jgi:hypothetical protein
VTDPLNATRWPAVDPPARAARLTKFKREQRIVEYLNRGMSVAEIAARVGVGEKRMRANIREILARRTPHPPEPPDPSPGAVAIQMTGSTRPFSWPSTPCRRPISRRSTR